MRSDPLPLALRLIAPPLMMGVLACRLSLGGPQRLAAGPPVSEAAATEAARSWETALEGAVVSGQLTVIVTEEQLTSSLASRLARDDPPVLRDPAVFLRDGEIQIFGEAQQGPIEMTVRLAITPVVDAQGRLGFEVSSADFGPLPAPDGLRASLSAMLSEALAGPMGSLATGFRVTSVAVADGELAIVAELR